jgi:hypothetical protein
MTKYFVLGTQIPDWQVPPVQIVPSGAFKNWHAALHVPGLRRISKVHSFASLQLEGHKLGKAISHVSPGSTIPLPHRGSVVLVVEVLDVEDVEVVVLVVDTM